MKYNTCYIVQEKIVVPWSRKGVIKVEVFIWEKWFEAGSHKTGQWISLGYEGKKKIVDSQYLAWKIKQIIIFEYGTDNILIWDIINVIWVLEIWTKCQVHSWYISRHFRKIRVGTMDLPN